MADRLGIPSAIALAAGLAVASAAVSARFIGGRLQAAAYLTAVGGQGGASS